jgi:TonB family protein
MERSSRSCAIALTVFGVVAGCTPLQNTPKQDYVWEMGRICDGGDRNWYLDRVDAAGNYTIRGAANAVPSPKLPYFDCMTEQFKATPYEAWLQRRSASSSPDRKPVPTVPARSGEDVALRPIEPRSQEYVDVVRKQILARMVYPPEASRAGLEGTTGVLLEIARDGSLVDARVTTSSGSEALDQAVITAVRSSAPFPPVPGEIAARTLTINGSFGYRIETAPSGKEP